MSDLPDDSRMLIACHDCDLLQHLPSGNGRGRVRCVRCNCLLDHQGHEAIAAPLALAFAALILLIVSNSFPLLEFSIQGQRDTTYLVGGIGELFDQGLPLLATVVMLTTLIAPAVQIVLLLHLYLPLSLGRRPFAFPSALRLAQNVLPWSMLEIFLLGVLVAAVKLAEQATIVAGPATWALGGLVLVLAAASAQVHPQRLWRHVE